MIKDLNFIGFVLWGIFLTFLHFIFVNILFKNHKLIFKPSTENTWAIVTGGTSGIGKSFVEHLYKLGYKVLVIGRNLEKLEKIKEELKDENNNLDIIQADFNSFDDYEDNIKNKIKDLKIGVLINNAAVSSDKKYFENMDTEEIKTIIECNIYSLCKMSQIVIYNMNKKYVNGTIINISSASSKLPFPFYSMYSASKSFMDTLTYNLSLENKMLNIKTLNPYFISTNMTKKRPSFFCPTSDKYVENIINKGYFLPHVIIFYFFLVSNFFFKTSTENYIYKYFKRNLKNH